jgi:hypothetical protein
MLSSLRLYRTLIECGARRGRGVRTPGPPASYTGLNLMYFVEVMLISLISVSIPRFIVSCDILWAVCYWLKAENAL